MIKSKPSTAKNGARRAERDIRKWIEFGELEAFFSRDNFDYALEESGFTSMVAEMFMRQHPVAEWAMLMPLNKADDWKLVEETAHRADAFIRRRLPDACYFASLLVMYQSLCNALDERASEKVMHDLEKLVVERIRGSDQLTRDGRGAPEKWDKYALEEAVRVALAAISKPSLMTLNKVAEVITQREELHMPLTGNMLGKLLKDKWGRGKYKELKAERRVQLEK